MDQHERLLRLVVRRLRAARANPPTVVNVLRRWQSWPLLLLAGTMSVILLIALDLPSEFPAVVAGIYLGMALRDLGIARQAVRLWPIQSEFFDWQKIDAWAQELHE